VRANLEPSDLPTEMQEPLPQMNKVVIIGGGDTAMDCVRSAVRLGAQEVTLIYRRTENEMPGRSEERQHANEEGARFEFLTAPVEVLTGDDGSVRGVRAQRMELGEPDDSGRARPVVIPDSEFDIDADGVILAIGYNVDPQWAEFAPDMDRDRWDRVVVDPVSMKTNVPGLLAGGDNVNGADLVVTAMADGQRAAAAIGQYLSDGEW